MGKRRGNGGERPTKRARASKTKGKREFDMSKHHQRHIALKISYVGWAYQGFAVQSHTEDTVEEQVLRALERTCLIVDRDHCNYSRGARTDKGVSAAASVIALRVRCKCEVGRGVVSKSGEEDLVTEGVGGEEMNYPQLLNRVLPSDIRCLAWAPVTSTFNARFDCSYRVYKYFFIKRGLDIAAMQAAAAHLVGVHNFSNFCKMDVVNVHSFERTMISAHVQMVGRVQLGDWVDEEICEVQLTGRAFLWHQVRCIMGVLFLVGKGLEEPSVVPYLLDLTRCPGKPAYAMASERPLVLHHCEYPSLDWHSEARETGRLSCIVQSTLQAQMVDMAVAGAVGRSAGNSHRTDGDVDVLLPGSGMLRCVTGDKASDTQYQYLEERTKEGTYEEKVAALSLRKRATRDRGFEIRQRSLAKGRGHLSEGEGDGDGEGGEEEDGEDGEM